MTKTYASANEVSKPIEKSTLEINSSIKKKYKFNCNTFVVLDRTKFENYSDYIEKTKGKDRYSPVMDSKIVRGILIGQTIELTDEQYEPLKNKTCFVNNERQGNLTKIYDERMRNSTATEKVFYAQYANEYSSCMFKRPMCELVA
jgi:hypothetical protein